MADAADNRLWFSHTIDALFIRALGEKRTPEVTAAIAAQGISLDKLQPAYPVLQVVRACRAILPLLYPRQPEGEAFRRLGVAFMQGYAETLVGKAMVAMMKLIGVRRSLERMQKNLGSGGNYITTRFTLLTPTSADLFISDVTDMPTFYVGLLEEGARMIGASSIRIEARPELTPAWTMRVDWSPEH